MCACVYACVSVDMCIGYGCVSVCVCPDPQRAPQEGAGGERGRTVRAPPAAWCPLWGAGGACVSSRRGAYMGSGQAEVGLGREWQAVHKSTPGLAAAVCCGPLGCCACLQQLSPDHHMVSRTFHLFQLQPCFPLTLPTVKGQIPGAITVWTLLLVWPLQTPPAHTGSDLMQRLGTRA